MKASTQRQIVRWIHIVLSIPILRFIYGPVGDPSLQTWVRFVFLPAVAVSGFWMWKGHVLVRRFNAIRPFGSAKEIDFSGR
jgi:hypothetical protein